MTIPSNIQLEREAIRQKKESKKQEKQKERELLSKRISLLRKEIGLSQVELGCLVGVSQDTISRWENGDEPSLRESLKLVTVFGIQLDDFFLSDDLFRNLLEQIRNR